MTTRTSPISDLAGHLLWAQDGTVWATWRLQGLRYAGTIEDKKAVRDLHRLLFRSLDGEALLLSTMLSEDSVQVVERMVDDVDLAQTPGWVAECEATLDALADTPMGERFYWLSVPLANTGKDRLTTSARAAWKRFQDRLDMPMPRRTPTDIQARVTQAAAVASLIPSPFRPVEASVAEQVWIATHPQRRGMLDDPVPAQMPAGMLSQPGSAELLTPTSSASIPEPILDEGSRTDLTDAGAFAKANVVRQRTLKVLNPTSEETSHQALLAVAETPSGGLTFPGSEFLHRLDQSGFDVDWAIRLRINNRDAVLPRNRKAVRDLNDQFSQRDAEAASGTGLHDLALAAELLSEYDQLFANDKLEVEVEHTIVLALGVSRVNPDDSDADLTNLVNEQAKALAKDMHDAAGMRLERIPGHQSELWWAMQPGAPRTALVKTYAQFTSSDHFAKLVPFIGNKIGGKRGPAFALNLATSRPQVVHIDLAGYPELDMSGAILAVAEMGAGKTVLLKSVANDLIDLGGQFFAIDKSEDGEWARFGMGLSGVEHPCPHQHDGKCDTCHAAWASSGAPTAVVVDPLAPASSMDPLLTMGLAAGPDVLRTFLVQLLNLDSTGPTGTLLTQVAQQDYLERHNLTSTMALCRHLAGGQCDLPDDDDRALASKLGQSMRSWSKSSIAAVIFDDSLPATDLTVDATVWRTHGMEQPTDEEMGQSHLFRQLPPEKIFGRAYYRLLCKMARALCFADRSRPAAFITDELYDFTQNRENVGDLQHFLRRGRRPKALLLAGTHDVGDLRDEVLAGLIPTRVVMRHRDAKLAANGLRWVGISESDPQFDTLLKKVTEDMSPVLGDDGVPAHRRGEALMRDAFGGIGLVRILPPNRPERRAAVFSTPPRARGRLEATS